MRPSSSYPRSSACICGSILPLPFAPFRVFRGPVGFRSSARQEPRPPSTSAGPAGLPGVLPKMAFLTSTSYFLSDPPKRAFLPILDARRSYPAIQPSIQSSSHPSTQWLEVYTWQWDMAPCRKWRRFWRKWDLLRGAQDRLKAGLQTVILALGVPPLGGSLVTIRLRGVAGRRAVSGGWRGGCRRWLRRRGRRRRGRGREGRRRWRRRGESGRPRKRCGRRRRRRRRAWRLRGCSSRH